MSRQLDKKGHMFNFNEYIAVHFDYIVLLLFILQHNAIHYLPTYMRFRAHVELNWYIENRYHDCLSYFYMNENRYIGLKWPNNLLRNSSDKSTCHLRTIDNMF